MFSPFVASDGGEAVRRCARIECGSSGNRAQANRLDLGVGAQRFETLHPTDAAFFEAAERGLNPKACAVHGDLTGVQAIGNAEGTAEVACPQTGRKPIGSAIGDLNRLRLSIECEYAEDRA